MELKDRVHTYPSPDEKQNIIYGIKNEIIPVKRNAVILSHDHVNLNTIHIIHNHGKRSILFSHFISQMPQKSPLNTINYGLWLMFCNALICFDERTNEQKRRIFMEKQQNCLLI